MRIDSDLTDIWMRRLLNTSIEFYYYTTQFDAGSLVGKFLFFVNASNDFTLCAAF